VDKKAIIKHILDNLHVHSKFPRDPCLYITGKYQPHAEFLNSN
jgi:hypothetical protein